MMGGMMKTTNRTRLMTRNRLFVTASTLAVIAALPFALALSPALLAPLTFAGVAVLLAAVGLQSLLQRPVCYALRAPAKPVQALSPTTNEPRRVSTSLVHA